ncbi:hypothetical protein [Nocardioides sp.]|uniref:hypothetical protein n=1 Tax=Nocardioides sp. TaxID=35761 RepID=UPI00356B5647
MSWERELFAFFDDLEQQADALYDAERSAELADRSRAEYQQVTLASRLMAALAEPVLLEVAGVGRLEGVLDRVGAGWCLVSAQGGDWVVSLAALESLRTSTTRSVPEVAWSPVARLGLGSALRRLADAGQPCLVHRRDGSALEVVVLRVGADFVEVRPLVHGSGTAGQDVLIAFTALAAVRSRP